MPLSIFCCFHSVPANVTRIFIENEPGGDKVVLKCVATGVPRPSITWQKAGEDVKPDGESTGHGNYTSQLTIGSKDNVEKYSCTVMNEYSDRPQRRSFAAPKKVSVQDTKSTRESIRIILCLVS